MLRTLSELASLTAFISTLAILSGVISGGF